MDIWKILEQFSVNIMIVLILIGAIIYIAAAPRLEKKHPPAPPEPEQTQKDERPSKNSSDLLWYYAIWKWFT